MERDVLDESKPHESVTITDQDLNRAVFEFLHRRGDITDGDYRTTLHISPGRNRYMWQRKEVTRG